MKTTFMWNNTRPQQQKEKSKETKNQTNDYTKAKEGKKSRHELCPMPTFCTFFSATTTSVIVLLSLYNNLCVFQQD